MEFLFLQPKYTTLKHFDLMLYNKVLKLQQKTSTKHFSASVKLRSLLFTI